jgi:hypothetical protein
MFGKWSAQLSLQLQKSVQAFDGTTSKVHVFPSQQLANQNENCIL